MLEEIFLSPRIASELQQEISLQVLPRGYSEILKKIICKSYRDCFGNLLPWFIQELFAKFFQGFPQRFFFRNCCFGFIWNISWDVCRMIPAEFVQIFRNFSGVLPEISKSLMEIRLRNP